jgi:hypothetical protein
MKIFTNQPNYDEFVKNEVETLTWLKTRAFFKDYSDLANIIDSAHLAYTSQLKKSTLIHFDFHAEFVMEVEHALRYVIIGANVTKNFDECSYFIALTEKDDRTKIIRKFHFDYADKTNSTLQNVPSFHLQYGGKASPHMKEVNTEKLDSWLSLPRLNLYPMNLALLLDMAFCEFRTKETNAIVESSEWRSLVYKNEIFLSKQFYENIYNHLTLRHKNGYLLRDFCYGI